MKRTVLRMIGIGLIAGVTLCALWQANRQPSENTAKNTGVTKTNQVKPALDSTLVIGRADAPLTMVEYSDYKCPECNKYYQSAGKELRRQYIDTGKAKLVFRMYPVFGEDAGLALYGSYCAADQGEFPRYYDAMFAYASARYAREGGYESAAKPMFTRDVIMSVATPLVKDAARFGECLDGKTHQAEFDAVMHAAARDAVQGTPTYVIGGQKIVGNQPYDMYRTLLEVTHE